MDDTTVLINSIVICMKKEISNKMEEKFFR